MTKGGATEEAANVIADVLREKFGLGVGLVNLKKQTRPELAPYKNVVIGGGVRGGKIYAEALQFVGQDFGDRKVAFFVCCGAGGNPKDYENACSKHLVKGLANYPNFKPVAVEAFGGRMRILGRTVFDNINIAKVRVWAELLGEKFTK